MQFGGRVISPSILLHSSIGLTLLCNKITAAAVTATTSNMYKRNIIIGKVFAFLHWPYCHHHYLPPTMPLMVI